MIEAMNKNTPGWAIELTGEKIDLDDLRFHLMPGFDPWIEDYAADDRAIALLRSASWESLQEAPEIKLDATRIVQKLIGLARLFENDAKPVGLGMVLKFGPDGRRLPILFAETVHLAISGGRVRFRGVGVLDPTASPQESKMQRWLRESESDDVRGELLIHTGRADDWYDLYKSMELAERLSGDQKKLNVIPGADSEQWKRVRQTANCYRHAPSPKFPLPDSPPTLQDARKFVFSIMYRIL